MRNFTKCFILFFTLFLVIPSAMFAAETGIIKGVVIDTITGEPLPGAAIAIKKQSLGAFTNANGEFVLNNVPAGSNALTISYLGYKTQELVINVSAKETKIIDFKLEVLANQVKEVVVSTQARGQRAAINQQLASTTISNVISSEKMRELPDNNAAEAIGRLPGVSLSRNAGEADKVIVRGISAKFNNVTLEGIKMVSTDINDRSVDLSLVQSESLSGVDVAKSLRADLDAEALGGTVNLQLGKAPDVKKIDFSAQGSYVNLGDNTKQSLSNYKVSGAYSDRFFDKKFGASLRISNELKQVPTQQYSGTFSDVIKEAGSNSYYINTNYAKLVTQSDARLRTNIAFVLDYSNSWWDVKFLNLLNWKTDQNVSYTDNYLFNVGLANKGGEAIDKVAAKAFWANYTRSHILKNEFNFGNSKVDLVLSTTYGQQHEGDNTFPLTQIVNWPALSNPNVVKNKDPKLLIQMTGASGAKWDTSNTYLNSLNLNNQNVITRANDVKIDYTLSYSFFDFISGKLKLGGKYHAMARQSAGFATSASFQWSAQPQAQTFGAFAKKLGVYPNDYGTGYGQRGILATNFVQHGYTPPKFLDGSYGTLGWEPDIDLLVKLENAFYSPKNTAFTVDPFNSYNKYYDANENTRAGYIETELNIGSKLMILPGIRYESYQTKYSAYIMKQILTGIQSNPPFVTVDQFHKDWFPSVNLKYKLTDDVSIQGAAYKSISKPDYSQVAPLTVYPAPNTSNYFAGTNPFLKPSTARNYDLGVTYNNKYIGLVTVYGFYKQIDNSITTLNNFRPLNAKKPGYIYGAPDSVDFNSRLLFNNWFKSATSGLYCNLPINNPERAYIKGLELAWSTNFWYLPGLLKGIVLDVNYTIMNSSAQYPYLSYPSTGILVYPTFNLRSGSLVDMPNSLLNIILGYDYKGFSGRLSYRYQTRTLIGLDGQYNSKDNYTAPFALLDLSLSQRINKKITCFANASNLTNHYDYNYFYNNVNGKDFPTAQNYYGIRVDVGLRVNL